MTDTIDAEFDIPDGTDVCPFCGSDELEMHTLTHRPACQCGGDQ